VKVCLTTPGAFALTAFIATVLCELLWSVFCIVREECCGKWMLMSILTREHGRNSQAFAIEPGKIERQVLLHV